MHEYVFKIKKGDIEIELKSDDISFFEKQLNKWRCDLLNKKYDESDKTESKQDEITDEIQEELNTQTEIERESQRILNEYKAELEQEEQQKEDFNEEIKNIIEESNNYEDVNNENVTAILDEETNETDFDNLLQESMSQCINNIQENRDESFINLINEKNITEKIDFLITTAYYLEKNQNYMTFTLNQINKKLTENSFEAIEYDVMKDAVDNGFAEIVQKEFAIETEYKLTEEYKSFVAERAQNNA